MKKAIVLPSGQLLVGYNIYPGSSSTNQNVALIIDSLRLHLTFVAFCLLPAIRKQ